MKLTKHRKRLEKRYIKFNSIKPKFSFNWVLWTQNKKTLVKEFKTLLMKEKKTIYHSMWMTFIVRQGPAGGLLIKGPYTFTIIRDIFTASATYCNTTNTVACVYLRIKLYKESSALLNKWFKTHIALSWVDV